MVKEEKASKETVRLNVHIMVPALPEDEVLALRRSIKELFAAYSDVRVDLSVGDVAPTYTTRR